MLLELAFGPCQGDADPARVLESAPAPTHLRQLREALYASIQTAVYWGPRDDRDQIADAPDLADALASYARRVEQTQLLGEAFAVTAEQVQIAFSRQEEESPGEQVLTLDQWRRQLIDSVDSFAAARKRRSRKGAGHVPLSGAWWSAPVGLPQTSDVWLDGVPVQLFGVEDDSGHENATATPVAAAPRSVLELSGPDAWVGLVREFPLDVTALMADTWGAAFPGHAAWHLPDWEAVSRRWDAVHLPLSGFMSTAGMPLRVDRDASTVLAGFDAGTTFWLTTAPTIAGEPTVWRRPADTVEWRG